MKGLPLSDMKKVSEDKKSATFRHKDGHEIKIAIGSLSPDMRKQLASLPVHAAEGDDVVAPSAPPYLAPNPSDEPVPTPLPGPGSGVIPADAADVALKSAGMQGVNPHPMDAQPSADPEPDEPQPVKPSGPAPLPADLEHGDAPGSHSSVEQELPPAQKLMSNDQALMQDLNNGHITPKSYGDLFANSGTLGKIGAIFGLMVSGAGAGLSHQPNMMMEMMNREIERDLEAQKHSKYNQINLLKLSQQGKLNNAEIDLKAKQGVYTQAQADKMKTENDIMTQTQARMNANRLAFHKIATIAASYPPGSKEQAEAQKQMALISSMVDTTQYHLADVAQSKLAFMNALKSPGSSGQGGEFQDQNMFLRATGNADLAKSRESKYVPGVGSADVDVPEDVRNKITAHQDVDRIMQNVLDFANKHGTGTSYKDRQQGATLMNQLQSKIRVAEDQGVFKKSEAEFMRDTVGDNPAGFLAAYKTNPKVSELRNLKLDEYKNLLKNRGLPYKPMNKTETSSGGENQSDQAMAWAQANSGDPRAAQILKKLGK